MSYTKLRGPSCVVEAIKIMMAAIVISVQITWMRAVSKGICPPRVWPQRALQWRGTSRVSINLSISSLINQSINEGRARLTSIGKDNVPAVSVVLRRVHCTTQTRTSLRADVSNFHTRKRDDASFPREEGNRGSARRLTRTRSPFREPPPFWGICRRRLAANSKMSNSAISNIII